MRILAILAFALVCTAPVHAQVLTKSDANDRAVTPDIMSERFNARADQIRSTYPPDTTVLRSSQFNATPADGAAENLALGNNVVVLIAVMTHDYGDLPVQRAFFRAEDGAETPLTLLGRFREPVDAESSARSLYGNFREDGFYLMPTRLLEQAGSVYVDFATRKDFRVFDPPVELPADLKGSGAPAAPDPAALETMLRRSFPGYDVQAKH